MQRYKNFFIVLTFDVVFVQNQWQAVIDFIYRLKNLKAVADMVGKQVC